jgi:WD40 repeat protein
MNSQSSFLEGITMRRGALLLLLFIGLTPPLQGQPKGQPKGGPPPTEFKVHLETGGHSQPIIRVGFKKDDKELVTVGKDGSIQVWDVATGKRLKKFLLPVLQVYDAVLSPDDRTVAVRVYGQVYEEKKDMGFAILLVNLDDGRILPLSTSSFEDFAKQPWPISLALAFSPTGDQLAAFVKRDVLVWPKLDQFWEEAVNLNGKQREAFFKPRVYPNVDGPKVKSIRLTFSPDSKHLLASRELIKDVQMLDATPGGEKKPGATLQGLVKIFGVVAAKSQPCTTAWAVDGKSLFVGGPKLVVGRLDPQGNLLNNYGELAPLQAWLGPATRISQLTALDEDNLLVSGSVELAGKQGPAGYVGCSVLDLKTGKTSNRFKEPELAGHLSLTALSHDKKLAVTTVNSGRDLVLWNIADGKVVRRIQNQAQTPAQIGWLKDKKRHVLAWGYATDPKDKDFGKFTHAFDLDQLQFVDAGKPKEYSGALHQLGDWSVDYKNPASRKQVLVEKKGGTQVGPFPEIIKAPSKDISAFTLVPNEGEEPTIAYATGGVHQQFLTYDQKVGNVNAASIMFPHIHDLAPSPDGKLLAIHTGTQQIAILYVDKKASAKTGRLPLLVNLYCTGQDWIAVHPQGYYAASPGGEKLMGWVTSNNILTPGTYHPASHFRKQFFRPDVIAHLLKEGDLKKALADANADLKAQGTTVPEEVELKDTLPPGGFIAKVDTSKKPEITVHVKAVAADPKDPLAKLELLADGRPLFDKDGVKTFAKPQAKAEAAFVVTLPPGSYKLTARIWSQKGKYSISSEVQVAYAPPAPPKQPKAKLPVIAIGASSYKFHPELDLPSPAKDATQIAKLLPQLCGPPLFAPGLNQTFIGPKATSADIHQAIKNLGTQVKADDLAILYFGGHGLKVHSGGLYLLTHDAKLDDLTHTALSGKALRDELAKVPCRVILILDACHSGTISFKGKAAGAKPAADDLIRELADDDCGVVVWCAAMAHEKAQVDEPSGHGLFTKCLLEALDAKKGAPPSKYDGKVYLPGVQNFVLEAVLDAGGHRQHPSLTIPATVEPFPLREVGK